MSIAFRSISSATAGAASSVTVNKPAGVRFHDVLIAAVVTCNRAAITPPAGWRPLNAAASEEVGLALFWRTAQNAEPGSYQWSFGAAEDCLASISAYAGVNPTHPILAEAGWNSGKTKRHATLAVKKGKTRECVAVSHFALAAYQPKSPVNEDLDTTDEKTELDPPRNSFEQGDDLLLSYNRRNEGSPFRKRLEISAAVKPRALQVADQHRIASGSDLYKTLPHPFSGQRAKAVVDVTKAVWGCAHILLLRPIGTIQFQDSSRNSGVGRKVVVARPAGAQPGNVMLAAVMVDENEDLLPGTPPGWNLIRIVYNEFNGRNTWHFFKIGGLNEPDEYVWQLTGEVA